MTVFGKGLYADYIYLHANEAASSANGAMWQGSGGEIFARTGGVIKNLSDIGSDSGTFDANNLPTLRPANSANDLGISGDSWDSLYVDHIYLSANEGSTSTNGVIWQG